MSNADISKYVITHKSPRFIPHETFMAEMVISTYAPQFCFLEDTCNIFNVCRVNISKERTSELKFMLWFLHWLRNYLDGAKTLT
jgi:hypothetical protein